jgi:hypothetical protein
MDRVLPRDLDICVHGVRGRALEGESPPADADPGVAGQAPEVRVGATDDEPAWVKIIRCASMGGPEENGEYATYKEIVEALAYALFCWDNFQEAYKRAECEHHRQHDPAALLDRLHKVNRQLWDKPGEVGAEEYRGHAMALLETMTSRHSRG